MHMEKVKVYAPGSIGNVGYGFDVFGLAIEAVGDFLEVEENNTGQFFVDDNVIVESDPDCDLEQYKFNPRTPDDKLLLDYYVS